MRPPRVGRPYGEVSQALLQAAAAGPASVRQLAERACVGYDVARFKAKDLVRAGVLQAHTAERPRVLGLPAAQPQGENPFALLERSFWERPASTEAAAD